MPQNAATNPDDRQLLAWGDDYLGKFMSVARVLAPSLGVLLLSAGHACAADQTIGDFEAAQQEAWNAHDAAAYAAAFDQTANIVTSLGWRWTGRTDATRNLGDGFKLVYAHARLTIANVQVRTLTPELASVALEWSITGARTIAGDVQAGEQHGYETQLLERRGETWVILAQQDTQAMAPMAAPSSSSAPPQSSQDAAPPEAFPTTPPPVRRCVLARANGECVIYGKPRPAPAS